MLGAGKASMMSRCQPLQRGAGGRPLQMFSEKLSQPEAFWGKNAVSPTEVAGPSSSSKALRSFVFFPQTLLVPSLAKTTQADSEGQKVFQLLQREPTDPHPWLSPLSRWVCGGSLI